MPEPESTPEGSKGLFGRMRAVSGRTILLVVVGLVLAVLFLRGGCAGIEVEESQAIATARAVLEADENAFTPERTEAKILRQGFPPTAMWVVVFTVQDPEGGSEDFLHHAAIWVDATSGEIRQALIDESSGG